MPTYQRETTVHAPLSEVWEFHSRIEGLAALTADWLNLETEVVRDPNGAAAEDGVLEAGSKIRMSLHPFGVGPRQQWTTHITRREEDDGTAVFEDVMENGPFPEWHHTHEFVAVSDDETLIRDTVEYELPVVRGLLGPVGSLFFEMMFRDRHSQTKELLEGGDWDP